jgi:hypothetical protein
MGHALRFPMGLAINPDDQVFMTDNQGVQNTFNEINHLVPDGRYGVAALADEPFYGQMLPPAIQVPHPWTQSVNGIFFLPDGRNPDYGPAAQANIPAPFAGHGIGCEFNLKFLVRFTLQRVGETYQGAIYLFSQPPGKETAGQFLPVVCAGVSPKGDIYLGDLFDSGWLGGGNVGEIVRLRYRGSIPLGIREIQAYEGKFLVSFTAPVDRQAASKPDSYDISGYTRVWGGQYATPDSGRHKLAVHAVDVAADGRSVVLHVDKQQAGHVYDVTCSRIGTDPNVPLWPSAGHYTMNRVPVEGK